MIRLSEIRINKFRGITDLLLTNLGNVNLIVGDNNCGKTSILEAIQLLQKPNDINNVLKVSKIRDSYSLFGRLPLYENFINMFPRDDYAIDVECLVENYGTLLPITTISFNLRGKLQRVMVDLSEAPNAYPRNLQRYYRIPDDTEINEFNGQLTHTTDKFKGKQEIKVNELVRLSGRSVDSQSLLKMKYLSPIDHMTSNTFNKIIRNEKYKEICINILQLFDKDIVDLLLIKNDISPISTAEYVKNRTTGLMPLSTYGDGIKKVLSLANAIAESANGILLIDEIETSIHAKYHDDIFKFILKAAKQYSVQLFITTHSIEAVDGLLKTQVQDEIYTTEHDPIRVVTLRKDDELHKTFSRTMTGKDVYANREKFNFEVRL